MFNVWFRLVHNGATSPGGILPNNGQYEEALSERGTIFRLQVYERVGISLVEVFERVGNLHISVGKKTPEG